MPLSREIRLFSSEKIPRRLPAGKNGYYFFREVVSISRNSPGASVTGSFTPN